MALVIDTGPMLAAWDRGDRHHARCHDLVREAEGPRVLPAPVLVELDYWCRTKLEPRVFDALLDDVLRGAFTVEALTDGDYQRVRELTGRYADVGFVDAAVLAVTERLGETKLATLNHRHFATMRPAHAESLTLLPG